MLRTIIASLLALIGVFWVFLAWQGPEGRSPHEHRMLVELNQAEGEQFRREQKTRPGVVDLGDGLLAEVLHTGTGAQPVADDWVRVHYRGAHSDGRVFDDTFRSGQPATLPLRQAIAGWQRALPAMTVGSRVRLVVPPELAYGEAGGGPVGPAETLVFEVELLAIVPPPVAPVRTPDQQAVPGL